MCDVVPPQQPPGFWKAMSVLYMCCTDEVCVLSTHSAASKSSTYGMATQ